MCVCDETRHDELIWSWSLWDDRTFCSVREVTSPFETSESCSFTPPLASFMPRELAGDIGELRLIVAMNFHFSEYIHYDSYFQSCRLNVCTGRHISQPVLRMDSLFCRARWRALESFSCARVMTYIRIADPCLREFTWRWECREFSMRQAIFGMHIT